MSLTTGIVYGFVIDTDGAVLDELDAYLDGVWKSATLEYHYTGTDRWSIPIIALKSAGRTIHSSYREVSNLEVASWWSFPPEEVSVLQQSREEVLTLWRDGYGPQVGEIGWIMFGSYG
jgi:hypothetical protein